MDAYEINYKMTANSTAKGFTASSEENAMRMAADAASDNHLVEVYDSTGEVVAKWIDGERQ